MKLASRIVLVLALGLVAAGCKTLNEPLLTTPGETMPDAGEVIVVDQVMVVVDASGSMYTPSKFAYAKELARSFVAAAPDGVYSAGLMTYGNEWPMDWLALEPQPFDREHMFHGVAQMKLLKGSTPLPQALDRMGDSFSVKGGQAAIVLFSDGMADPADTMDRLAFLHKNYSGSVCVYTVQMGDEDEGKVLLGDMVRQSPCGMMCRADDVAEPEAMQRFVRKVFFGLYRDSDGDGVPDSEDHCPGTPRGVPVNERGCWILEGLHFDTDSVVIKPMYNSVLDEAAAVLKQHGIKVRIDGHTDARASEAYNQTLSMQRARSVKKALVQRGVPAARLSTKGFGESQPVAPNNSAANMAKNRRVELTIMP